MGRQPGQLSESGEVFQAPRYGVSHTSRQTRSSTPRVPTAPRVRRGPLDTPLPPEPGRDGYLGRVCDVVPVGGWELQLPGQDLVEEIFLEVVLTESVREKQKSQRHHSAL